MDKNLLIITIGLNDFFVSLPAHARVIILSLGLFLLCGPTGAIKLAHLQIHVHNNTVAIAKLRTDQYFKIYKYIKLAFSV